MLGEPDRETVDGFASGHRDELNFEIADRERRPLLEHLVGGRFVLPLHCARVTLAEFSDLRRQLRKPAQCGPAPELLQPFVIRLARWV